MEKISDILIIGGGAAGLACAVSASNIFKNLSITIAERMPKVGKKILVTGNGRCNLSNVNMSEKFYHGTVDVGSLISEFSDIRPFMGELGLFTYTDGAGRIYPLSNTAASVNDALRFAVRERGVEVITDCDCTQIRKNGGCFSVSTSCGEIKAKAVVLACGGASARVHGSNGSGFTLAESMGLELNRPYPALCPLTAEGTKGLEGLRAGCKAELVQNGKTTAAERGEVQFTKSGLSGICIFNLSACFNKENSLIKLDLAPEYSISELKDMLFSAAEARRGCEVQDCFTGIFSRQLALYLLKRSGISLSKNCSELSENEIKSFAETAKGLSFKITGRSDFASAQVTAGGVKGSETDFDFMTKKVKGLFLCGEILDVWGDCGGYNLHFAFASGIKAGKSAACFVNGSS